MLLVSLRGCEAPSCRPSCLMWSFPMRTGTYDNGPVLLRRFLFVALHKLIRQYRKRHLPKVPVIICRQLGVDSFEGNRDLFSSFHVRCPYSMSSHRAIK